MREEESHAGHGHTKYRGPKTRPPLVCPRKIKAASTEVECPKGRSRGSKTRQNRTVLLKSNATHHAHGILNV